MKKSFLQALKGIYGTESQSSAVRLYFLHHQEKVSYIGLLGGVVSSIFVFF